MPIFQPSLPLDLSNVDGAYSAIRNVKDSLRQDIINLMLTNPGGHPFRPNVGIGLKRYLFELNTSPVWANLKQNIVTQVNNYVDGVDILDVNVEFDMSGQVVDRNTAVIKITWQISRTLDSDVIVALMDPDREDILISSNAQDYSSGEYATSDFVDGEWIEGRPGTAQGRPW